MFVCKLNNLLFFFKFSQAEVWQVCERMSRMSVQKTVDHLFVVFFVLFGDKLQLVHVLFALIGVLLLDLNDPFLLLLYDLSTELPPVTPPLTDMKSALAECSLLNWDKP